MTLIQYATNKMNCFFFPLTVVMKKNNRNVRRVALLR